MRRSLLLAAALACLAPLANAANADTLQKIKDSGRSAARWWTR